MYLSPDSTESLDYENRYSHVKRLQFVAFCIYFFTGLMRRTYLMKALPIQLYERLLEYPHIALAQTSYSRLASLPSIRVVASPVMQPIPNWGLLYQTSEACSYSDIPYDPAAMAAKRPLRPLILCVFFCHYVYLIWKVQKARDSISKSDLTSFTSCPYQSIVFHCQ